MCMVYSGFCYENYNGALVFRMGDCTEFAKEPWNIHPAHWAHLGPPSARTAGWSGVGWEVGPLGWAPKKKDKYSMIDP
jgi:hypothetical protein